MAEVKKTNDAEEAALDKAVELAAEKIEVVESDDNVIIIKDYKDLVTSKKD